MMEDAIYPQPQEHPEEVGPYDVATDAVFTMLVTGIRRSARWGPSVRDAGVPAHDAIEFNPDEYMFGRDAWDVIDHVPDSIRKEWGAAARDWQALRRQATL